MAAQCSRCGGSWPDGTATCPRDGTALTPSAAPPPAPGPRRRAGLFAALAFTALVALAAAVFLFSHPTPAPEPKLSDERGPHPPPPIPEPTLTPPPPGGRPTLAPALETPAPAKAPAVAEEAHLALTASVPCDAFADGQPAGKVPLPDLALAPGHHELTCKNAFGGEARGSVELAAGAKRELSLEFKTGTLTVRVIPFADVFIDGRAYGETPLAPVELVEGAHTVELRRESKRLARTVRITNGQPASLEVNIDAP